MLHFNTKEIFDRVPMFRHAPNATRLALSGLLSPTTLFPGDTIFDINTTADLCYFVYNGSVEIFLPGHVIGKNDKTRKRMGAYGSVAGKVCHAGPKWSMSSRKMRAEPGA